MRCPRCGATMRLEINMEATVTLEEDGHESMSIQPQQDKYRCHDCFLELTPVSNSFPQEEDDGA